MCGDQPAGIGNNVADRPATRLSVKYVPTHKPLPTYVRRRLSGCLAQRVPSCFLDSSFRMCLNCAVLKGVCLEHYVPIELVMIIIILLLLIIIMIIIMIIIIIHIGSH